MAVKEVNGNVRTFIPHSLKRMPTVGRMTRILKTLHRQGKPFAINVNLSSSNLISQINIGTTLARKLAKYLHSNHMILKIGTPVKLIAKPIGFGQMDAIRILRIDGKVIAKTTVSKADRYKESSTRKSMQSRVSLTSNSVSVNSTKFISSSANTSEVHPLFSASATSTTSSMFSKLDSLTTNSSDEDINHKVAVMYRRLEKHPTDVKSIPKQLKPIFEQEDWKGFIRKLNKNARHDFDKIVNNPHVNHWMNYALRSNYIPRDLDDVDKIQPKKKAPSNHKDVF